MKKIFTTLAAALMVVSAANAEVVVTYNGKTLANGEEIVVTNQDFEYLEFPEFGLYQYKCDVAPEIESGNPAKLVTVTKDESVQTCPGGNCVMPEQKGDEWVVDTMIEKSDWSCDIHFIWNGKTLPDLTQSIKVTITDDDDEPFTFTVTANMKDNSGVEEIADGAANVVAVYDMQGRRVNGDFRGAAIVVYDNGKAAKVIRN